MPAVQRSRLWARVAASSRAALAATGQRADAPARCPPWGQPPMNRTSPQSDGALAEEKRARI